MPNPRVPLVDPNVTPNDGDVLTWNDSAAVYRPGATRLDFSGASDGDALVFNASSGKFEAHALVDLDALALPVSVTNGGTGADMSGALTFAKTADGDTATSTMFLSATDSGATTSNVSAGIELPNSVGVAGDLVIRTGSLDASGSGTERLRVTGSLTGSLGVEAVEISGAALFANTLVPLTDFAGMSGAVNIQAKGGSGFGNGLTISDGVVVYPGAVGALNVALNDSAHTIAAVFSNADTSGNADLVQLRFKSFEAPGISAIGTFEFQNDGLGTGGAFFGMNFDWTNTDIFQFFSDGGFSVGNVLNSPGPGAIKALGNVDAASFSAASTPGGSDSFSAGGKMWTFTGGLFVSAV